MIRKSGVASIILLEPPYQDIVLDKRKLEDVHIQKRWVCETQLLREITPGLEDTRAGIAFAFHDRLFFTVWGDGNSTLWVTNGTPENTLTATEVFSGEVPASVYLLAQNTSEVYFFTYASSAKHDQLWHLVQNQATYSVMAMATTLEKGQA